MAIQVEAFCALSQFQERLTGLTAHLKGCPLAPGFAEILLPGEPEARERERRLREGIVIEAGIWQTLEETLARLAVPLCPV